MIVMRIYMQKNLFKKESTIDQYVIHDFLHSKLLKLVIRGINGISAAKVEKGFVPRSVVDDDGSIKIVRKNIITTTGTNLADIINNKYVDAVKTTSNSILEIQKLYGIHAAKMKLIQCLREMSGVDINVKHYMLIADTLTYNGFISSIEKSGLEECNPNNALLSVSYSHPLQRLTDAALNNDMSVVKTNISSSLLMGTTPDIGCNYNSVIMNEQFIKDNQVDINSMIKNL